MAVTITDIDAGPPQQIVGGTAGYKAVVKTIAFDSSYPTGGETLGTAATAAAGAAALGLSTILFLHASSTSGYMFEYDYAGKLLAYYGDNNNASDGPLIEVPNTTDLSALTSVRVLAIGT